MERLEMNLETGEFSVIQWTEEEIAEFEALQQQEELAPDPTPAEKLAAAGLTVEELKELLGLS
jgi:hypothetical protein